MYKVIVLFFSYLCSTSCPEVENFAKKCELFNRKLALFVFYSYLCSNRFRHASHKNSEPGRTFVFIDVYELH